MKKEFGTEKYSSNFSYSKLYWFKFKKKWQNDLKSYEILNKLRKMSLLKIVDAMLKNVYKKRKSKTNRKLIFPYFNRVLVLKQYWDKSINSDDSNTVYNVI